MKRKGQAQSRLRARLKQYQKALRCHIVHKNLVAKSTVMSSYAIRNASILDSTKKWTEDYVK